MSFHAVFTWIVAIVGVAAMLSLAFIPWVHEPRPERDEKHDGDSDDGSDSGDRDLLQAA